MTRLTIRMRPMVMALAVVAAHVSAFHVPTTTTTTTTRQQRHCVGAPILSRAAASRSSTSTTTRLYSTNELIQVERATRREVGPFQEWAAACGVQKDEGFGLLEMQQTTAETGGTDVEEYYAATSTGGAQGTCVLYVPSQVILSADRIAQEYADYSVDMTPSWNVLESMGLSQYYREFVLFTKVLVEYEQGQQSAYYNWFNAMPRKWNTAVSMDDFCLSCLPPYIKSLCVKEINHLAAFMFALQSFPLTAETKENKELLKFAYNVVFTRSFPNENAGGDMQIIPMVDMFNHGYPGNAALVYDEAGGCQVVLTQDVAPGQPLLLTYAGADPTNPSQLLARYGFLDETSLPATYCKLLFPNPSPELLAVGYGDESQMHFYTENGGISQAVWDVLLYSRLERKPELAEMAQAFYQAHLSGDEATKSAIHSQYFKETVKALQRHVNHILIEVHELTVKMNAYDASQHPRLPLLRQHHQMVTTTFQKVRANLDQMMAQQAQQ